jgi:hypothetical protein
VSGCEFLDSLREITRGDERGIRSQRDRGWCAFEPSPQNAFDPGPKISTALQPHSLVRNIYLEVSWCCSGEYGYDAGRVRRDRPDVL